MRPTKPSNKPPAAALRDQIVTYFNEDEVRALAFDLGLEYESLSGTSKVGKSGSLIQQAARNSKIVDLIEACRTQRPDANWNDVGVAAATNPQQFLFVPDDQPLINASPDRALRLGAIAGIIATLLLVCGFGGGLAAGQVVNVTLNPIQPDPSSLETVKFRIGSQDLTPNSIGATFEDVIEAITTGSVRPGVDVAMELNDVQATTVVDQAVTASPDSPIREPHVRFLSNGEVTVNFRASTFGNRRVALSYTMRTEGGRLILSPRSGWFNVVDIPGTTIGWLPLPGAVQEEATRWGQAQLDRATRWLSFTDVQATTDQLRVSARTR